MSFHLLHKSVLFCQPFILHLWYFCPSSQSPIGLWVLYNSKKWNNTSQGKAPCCVPQHLFSIIQGGQQHHGLWETPHWARRKNQVARPKRLCLELSLRTERALCGRKKNSWCQNLKTFSLLKKIYLFLNETKVNIFNDKKYNSQWRETSQTIRDLRTRKPRLTYCKNQKKFKDKKNL